MWSSLLRAEVGGRSAWEGKMRDWERSARGGLRGRRSGGSAGDVWVAGTVRSEDGDGEGAGKGERTGEEARGLKREGRRFGVVIVIIGGRWKMESEASRIFQLSFWRRLVSVAKEGKAVFKV
jgi:hypothetical protein